nr:MAG: DNA topoisomerase I, archaeal [Candidatus Nanosalinarum sp. J07AB56]
MTTVLVAEKPKVASRIANALGSHETIENRGVKNYRIETDEGELVVSPAVGHIFNLEDAGDDWEYPAFETEWLPIFETDDSAGYVRKYYRNLEDQLEDADEYVNACDLDLEGSVIGFTVLNFIADAPEERVKRMKFSTLTSSDLQEAFDDLDEFDEGMTEAGLARHVLDFYYGINLSRALMKAVQDNDRYETLSTGRVQGPALKLLADRERDIQAFDPDDYWEIYAQISGLEAQWRNGDDDRIWSEDEAEATHETVREAGEADVSEVSKRDYKHRPPIPFNLTGLQKEASSQIGLSPKRTQSVAQNLYEQGLISYPRTESQKLPPKIGYESILKQLKAQEDLEDGAETVLDKENLYTTQGSKEDDAHPAIYPTGKTPSGLDGKDRKLYELVAKRFLAVFGDAAQRRSVETSFSVEEERFSAKAKFTLERNWYDLYEPFVNVSDDPRPDFSEGDTVQVEEVDLEAKETQPPNRYSQSTIVSEMEDRDLGTKATRADTIQSLYDRDFIDGGRIEVTRLGLAIVEALEEYCPEILSEDLTRRFEELMEDIRRGEETRENVLEEAREELGDILDEFEDHQGEIGEFLVEAIDERREERRRLGPCQECEDGMLRIVKTSNGRFVGCSSYPECENTYPLPGSGSIESRENPCDECGKPMIYVARSSSSNFSMCIDPDCPSKDDWD